MTRHRPVNAYENVAAARGAGKSAVMAAGAMLALAAMSPWAWSATPELVSATCFGGPGADLAEGVAIAPAGPTTGSSGLSANVCCCPAAGRWRMLCPPDGSFTCSAEGIGYGDMCGMWSGPGGRECPLLFAVREAGAGRAGNGGLRRAGERGAG